MLLYALGACALAEHSAMSLQASPWPRALLVYASFFWFLLEYMCLECVHLYTYDLFCEKLDSSSAGAAYYSIHSSTALGSGRSFYPKPQPTISAASLPCSSRSYSSADGPTRGANLQKYLYKRGLEHPLLIISKFLASGNHTIPNTRLLCTGFWGLARHINYCGEIVQAVALALPGTLVATTDTTHSSLGCTLYYIALIPRQIDDDLQIATKMERRRSRSIRGACRWRIVPGVW